VRKMKEGRKDKRHKEWNKKKREEEDGRRGK
jgi:hypothetical protein